MFNFYAGASLWLVSKIINFIKRDTTQRFAPANKHLRLYHNYLYKSKNTIQNGT